MENAHEIIGLINYLRDGGTIPAARCSSAQARGEAKRYAYWGAARYEIRWSARLQRPTAVCVSRASSDRRSERLAERDTEDLAERIGGIEITSIGELRIGELKDAAAWVAAG